MSLTACTICWGTPCTCGYQYWFMDLRRLEQVAKAARKVLGDRRGGRRPPGLVREELERRARLAALAKVMAEADRVDAPVPHDSLDAFVRRRFRV